MKNNEELRLAATLILLTSLILTGASNAQASRENDIEAAVDEELEIYFPYEDRVAGWVDNTARAIDSFFGNDKASARTNKNYF